MDWLSQNWFWVLLVGLFVVAHLFGHGHGGCGMGHGRRRTPDDGAPDNPRAHPQ